MEEPEKITIIEGPTPDFRPSVQLWNWGIYQGTEENDVRSCELRTAHGEDIRDRCKNAWREGRIVELDYPDKLRLRRTVEVVALRLNEIQEGTVLSLWVYLPYTELLENDDDNDFFD